MGVIFIFKKVLHKYVNTCILLTSTTYYKIKGGMLMLFQSNKEVSYQSTINKLINEEKRLMVLQDKLLDELIDATIVKNEYKIAETKLKLQGLVNDLAAVRKQKYSGR